MWIMMGKKGSIIFLEKKYYTLDQKRKVINGLLLLDFFVGLGHVYKTWFYSKYFALEVHQTNNSRFESTYWYVWLYIGWKIKTLKIKVVATNLQKDRGISNYVFFSLCRYLRDECSMMDIIKVIDPYYYCFS